MKRLLFPVFVIVVCSNNIFAQSPVVPLANQKKLLQSNDVRLAVAENHVMGMMIGIKKITFISGQCQA